MTFTHLILLQFKIMEILLPRDKLERIKLLKKLLSKDSFGKLQVVYGTRLGRWYVINEHDRDYNTDFAVSIHEFISGKLPKNFYVL